MNCLTAEAATRCASLAKPLDQLRATHPTIVGRLAKSASEDRLIGSGHGRQVRRSIDVLHQELPRIRAVERTRAGEQLLEYDRQAVLVRKTRHPALERLGGGIDRRHPAGDRRADALQQSWRDRSRATFT